MTALAVADPTVVARPQPERRASDTKFLVLALLLASLPVFAVLATRIGSSYLALGDEANIGLRVRDVFTSSIPLVGVYSRGFNHPGPLLFWLLAPFSRVAGGRPWGTLVGGAVLQGFAIGAAGWLAFKRGGLTLMLLVLAALGLGYSAFSAGIQFLQAWNPNVAFPFFMLFLLQIWALVTGWRWQLLGAALTATLLVQLHVSYLPLVIAAALWALIVVVRDRHTTPDIDATGDPAPWRTVLVVTAAAGALLWIAPVIQQLTHSPGNVGQLFRYFNDPTGSAAGLAKGAGLLAAEFAITPPWLGGHDSLAFGSGIVAPASMLWLLIPAVLLSVGFFAAHRTGRVADRRLLELATITGLASIVAISRVTVDLQPFLFFFRIIAALFIVVASIWAVANWSGLERRPAARVIFSIVGLVVIAASFGARAHVVLNHRGDLGLMETQTRALVSAIEQHGAPRAPVLVRGLGATTNGFAQGLFDALDRDHVPVRVDPQYGFQYGDQRTAARSDVREVWYVSPDGRTDSLLAQQPGARVVAYNSALDTTRDLHLTALQRTMATQLRAAGHPDLIDALDSPFFAILVKEQNPTGVDLVQAQKIADLNDRIARKGGCRCTVIAFPAATAPQLPFTMGF